MVLIVPCLYVRMQISVYLLCLDSIILYRKYIRVILPPIINHTIICIVFHPPTTHTILPHFCSPFLPKGSKSTFNTNRSESNTH